MFAPRTVVLTESNSLLLTRAGASNGLPCATSNSTELNGECSTSYIDSTMVSSAGLEVWSFLERVRNLPPQNALVSSSLAFGCKHSMPCCPNS